MNLYPQQKTPPKRHQNAIKMQTKLTENYITKLKHKSARVAAGVLDGTIRLSVGIEDISDILSDLRQALENT